MVTVTHTGVFLIGGREIVEDRPENSARLRGRLRGLDRAAARRDTMAARILAAHHAGTGDPADGLRLRFDALASHDITFVNIIQTARESGLERFPVPYVLTNCHNALCAVGGTINGDDHRFGLSAARRYGGVYVPPHLAVIHTYVRETLAASGAMILGSDSHTRYGFLGAMGVGEGGGELVKQLLRQTCDLPWPRVVAVYLHGTPRPGVGPQDVALALIRAVFRDGFARNAVLEFVGPGVAGLPADFRAGVDVMTTETACWSSIWETDETVREYLTTHHRPDDYRELHPGPTAYYDGLVAVDLGAVRPMIALPFHPSNAVPIDEFLAAPGDALREVERDAAGILGAGAPAPRLTDKVDARGRVRVDQAVVAGCAGGVFDNLMAMRSILDGHSARGGEGNEGFCCSVYPGSQPIFLELAENGALASLLSQGIVVRSAFCGPCFGAGDVPPNNGLSIRHATRNFPNREGARPAAGQAAAVCLMDARSIAATAMNGGYLASAADLDWVETPTPYHYGPAPYLSRVYNGVGRADPDAALVRGPNITDWPAMPALGGHLLIRIASRITDPVTTTDELIPSGETSSYRSNPVALAEFTLSRKDPGYVARAKAVREAAGTLAAGDEPAGWERVLRQARGLLAGGGGVNAPTIQIGSAIFARKPGDGSAREQAASCQRVLGGCANFAREYATKRYRSNLINWGMLPLTIGEGGEADRVEALLVEGAFVLLPGIAGKIRDGAEALDGWILDGETASRVCLPAPVLTAEEREILLAGSLINHNRRRAAAGR